MNWTLEGQVLIQGITEPLGSYYAARMKAWGTNIVAGIRSGSGEGEQIDEIPVFDLVEEAIAQVGEVETALIFVPPYQVLDAALEAIASGIRQIIIISSGVPPLDMVRLLPRSQATNTRILGPGSTGLIVPGKIWLGTSEPQFYTPGKVGIIGRTGRLNDEVALTLSQAGWGQSLAVSLGAENLVGSGLQQWLPWVAADRATEAILLLGQTNSIAEENVAEYIGATLDKPAIAYIAGVHSTVERPLRDAASIIATQLSHSVSATGREKQAIAALKKANVKIAKRPAEIPQLLEELEKSSPKAHTL